MRGYIIIAVVGSAIAGSATSAQAYSWTAPRAISTSPGLESVREARLGADANGNAWAAWGEAGTVKLRTVSHDGALGPTSTVGTLTGQFSDFSLHRIDLAVNGAGNGTIVWRDANNALSAARLSEAGIGRTTPIAPRSRTDFNIAVDATGNTTIVWSEKAANGYSRLSARRLDSTGAIGSAVVLGRVHDPEPFPRVAMDAQGNAAIVWGAPSGARLRIWSASGVLSATRRISSQSARMPRVAVAPGGAGVVVWVKAAPHARRVLRGRRITMDGRVEAATTISHFEPWDGTQDVAVDANGNAEVVWDEEGRARAWDYLRARRFTPASKVRRLRTIFRSGAPLYPEVGVAPGGRGLVAWLGYRRLTITVLDSSGRPVRTKRLPNQEPIFPVVPAVGLTDAGLASIAWQSNGEVLLTQGRLVGG